MGRSVWYDVVMSGLGDHMGTPPLRTVGIRELKARTSAVLRELQASGAEFVITVRGRPVARLEPLAAEDVAGMRDGMGGLRGALSDLPPLEWEDFATAQRAWEPDLLDDE
jgi:prevent-host-death family protein